MWVVCGPPRSGTTAMLQAIAAWTTLRIRWDVVLEWRSRELTGSLESFLELTPPEIPSAGDDEVVKVLDPGVDITPTRAILMIRDPALVSRSARRVLGQLISPEEVTARVDAFRAIGWPIDEVDVAELDDQRALFVRLARSGWPVLGLSTTMTTKAVR